MKKIGLSLMFGLLSLGCVSFADDALVCDNGVNILLYSDERGYVAEVADYRENTRYTLQTSLVRSKEFPQFTPVSDAAVLKEPVQDLRLIFDNGSSVKQEMLFKSLNHLDDGEEITIKVRSFLPGGPTEKEETVRCHYAQS